MGGILLLAPQLLLSPCHKIWGCLVNAHHPGSVCGVPSGGDHWAGAIPGAKNHYSNLHTPRTMFTHSIPCTPQHLLHPHSIPCTPTASLVPLQHPFYPHSISCTPTASLAPPQHPLQPRSIPRTLSSALRPAGLCNPAASDAQSHGGCSPIPLSPPRSLSHQGQTMSPHPGWDFPVFSFINLYKTGCKLVTTRHHPSPEPSQGPASLERGQWGSITVPPGLAPPKPGQAQGTTVPALQEEQGITPRPGMETLVLAPEPGIPQRCSKHKAQGVPSVAGGRAQTSKGFGGERS